MGKGSDLETVWGLAAKIAEHAGRLAAVLSFVENQCTLEIYRGDILIASRYDKLVINILASLHLVVAIY